jgi:HSP20 family molecular chaperone IbpA
MADLTVRQHLVNDLEHLKQDFERAVRHIFKHHFYPAPPEPAFLAVVPPIETWIDAEDKEFHLSVPLPGIKPEKLHVNLEGNYLTFEGERDDEEDEKGKNYLEREFSYQRFIRTVMLPDGVDGDKLTAELKHGVLQITAPIAASVLPKKIQVKTSTDIATPAASAAASSTRG